MDILKPCPFCGGDGERKDHRQYVSFMFWVFCTKCQASSGWQKSEEEATLSWNQRIESVVVEPDWDNAPEKANWYCVSRNRTGSNGVWTDNICKIREDHRR